jgi:hypothetical protein
MVIAPITLQQPIVVLTATRVVIIHPSGKVEVEPRDE